MLAILLWPKLFSGEVVIPTDNQYGDGDGPSAFDGDGDGNGPYADGGDGWGIDPNCCCHDVGAGYGDGAHADGYGDGATE